MVSITSAFGTSSAVFVFLMKVTDAAGMEIWNKNISLSSFFCCCFFLNHAKRRVVDGRVAAVTAVPAHLGISAEDFGVETDPVVGDEHFSLVQDVSLQGAGVAC